MGRDKLSVVKKQLRGNPGKRSTVKPPVFDLPEVAPPGHLTPDERIYWDKLAPSLIADGRLNQLSLPAFIHFIRVSVRRDDVDAFLKETKMYWQETAFTDSSGQEHKTLKESAPSKLSRDLSQTCSRLEKLWGITGVQMQGLQTQGDEMDEFMRGKHGKE